MSRDECCVPGCGVSKGDGIPLHRFPNPAMNPERYQTWVTSVLGVLCLEDKDYVYNNLRVCRKHFRTVYLYGEKRLCRLAIPELSAQDQRRISENELTSASLPQTSIDVDTSNLQIDAMSNDPIPVTRLQLQHNNNGTVQQRFRTLKHKNRKQDQSHNKRKITPKRITKTKAFKTVARNLKNMNAKTFFLMQIRQSGKRARGLKFSVDEKVLALSLYKPSPKAYRVLNKFCVLPSRRTLQNILYEVKISPGFNNRIFIHMKNNVAEMRKVQRYCTLVFDEMAIAPSCCYNRTRDSIEGFVDDGEQKEEKFCDHVLVFMIRGIDTAYKQPVYFSYSAGTTKMLQLKKQIKEVITKLQKAGLIVVATICDQGTTNVSAIKSLVGDTRATYLRNNKHYTEGFFEINNEMIYFLYDPPHLLKCIRNNLLYKNLNYVLNGKTQTAKWSHILNLYHRPPNYKGSKLVQKLTSQHVMPNHIPKMRVMLCTQVFSHSVGAALGFFAQNNVMPKECTQTADLMVFFDRLFDSLNCGRYEFEAGKPYRNPVKPESAHHKLWSASLPVLKSMKFDTPRHVPSLAGWVKTIENIRKVVQFLHNKGIKSILLRRLNQDALENFFGAIRAHGYANIMPNCSSFEAAYKTLLLNNLSSKHSLGANCEADNDECLDSLKFFLTSKDEHISNEGISVVDYEHMNMELIDTTLLINNKDKNSKEKCAAIGYCSGWLARQAKKKVFKNCQMCLKSMESDYEETFHGYIKVKEYEDKRWLCYPTRVLFDFFAHVEYITFSILRTSALKRNIAEYIKLVVTINTDLNFITCVSHKRRIKNFMINKSVIFFIHIWCKEVGHLLTGKALVYDEDDPFKKKAHTHYKTNRGRKRFRQTGTELNL